MKPTTWLKVAINGPWSRTRKRDDYDIYAPIIERIRSPDVICCSTLLFAGSIDAPHPLNQEIP
jgi:hypothetical protein